jgi:peptidyl-prolyl cis-trans isomerase SurA
MKNKISNKLLILLLFTVSHISNAQTTETPLLEINGKTYSLEEFNYIYNKNNPISKEPLSKKEYLDLFVNYKLKVTEAEAQGMDTMPDFKKELEYYRNELAKPYLYDKKATEKVAREAYDRMLEEVDVSHILIMIPKNPFPEDTLKAYKKITDIRNELLNGADFEETAFRYSEDPSAKKNRGHLGYITVFQTVYPFETAAYTTPVGEISPIIKTSFGYHIIKVNAKRKSPGEIKVAHIMKVIPRNASPEVQAKAKHEIDSVYTLLQNGADFKELAMKFSDDRNTGPSGGELNWFGTGRMIPEFAEAAFALKDNGDISGPVRTRVGWHIIKKIDQREIKPFEEQKDELVKKVSNSKRALAGKTSTIKRLKKDNGFKVDSTTLKAVKELFAKNGISKEDFVTELKNPPETLCTIGDSTFTTAALAVYLNNSKSLKPGSSPLELDKKINDFLNESIIAVENANLEKKYPEFRYLLNEYHDGLLIFEISQNEIWNKASADSTELRRYYEEHKEKYVTPDKFSGNIFFCKNKKALNTIESLVKDSVTQSSLDSLKSILGKDFIHKSGEFEKGTDDAVDAALWDTKAKLPDNMKKSCFYGHFEKGRQQKFENVKGLVIADYQSFIEKNWMNSLKEKYKPEVHYNVLKKSKK